MNRRRTIGTYLTIALVGCFLLAAQFFFIIPKQCLALHKGVVVEQLPAGMRAIDGTIWHLAASSAQEMEQISNLYGIRHGAISRYDAGFFVDHALIMVVHNGGTDSRYTVSKLHLKNGVLAVPIRESILEVSELLGVSYALYIEVDKELLPEGAQVDVTLTQTVRKLKNQ